MSARDLRCGIGAADAWLSAARLQRQRMEADAAASLGKAIGLFDALLRQPESEWIRQGLASNELGEARYNACCALALASTPAGGRIGECRASLEALVTAGDATASELAADDDLAHLRGVEWWPLLSSGTV